MQSFALTGVYVYKLDSPGYYPDPSLSHPSQRTTWSWPFLQGLVSLLSANSSSQPSVRRLPSPSETSRHPLVHQLSTLSPPHPTPFSAHNNNSPSPTFPPPSARLPPPSSARPNQPSPHLAPHPPSSARPQLSARRHPHLPPNPPLVHPLPSAPRPTLSSALPALPPASELAPPPLPSPLPPGVPHPPRLALHPRSALPMHSAPVRHRSSAPLHLPTACSVPVSPHSLLRLPITPLVPPACNGSSLWSTMVIPAWLQNTMPFQ